MLAKKLLQLQMHSQKVAIRYGEQEISYKELHTESNKISNYLREEDLGDNIGIFLPNSIQYAVAYFSIAFLDKVIVPVGIQAKETELKSTASYCELRTIITNTSHIMFLQSTFEDYDYRINIFDIDTCKFLVINPESQFIELSENIGGGSENSVAIMLHTSGTTSEPKRVMLTHRNLISNIKSNIESLKLTCEDKTLIALPMYFGYCNTAQFLTHIYLGASIVIMDTMFMPKEFFTIVEKQRITNFTGVPTMLLVLLAYRYRDIYDISSLKYVCFGGGKMPVAKLKELIAAFPTVGFVQTYGQTEASPRVTALLPADALRKAGSVGKPIPNVSVRIVDEQGKDVETNQPGEIIVYGDNVMRGYYKRPETTAQTIVDGWLRTGDLAVYDEEGYIYLVGRKKNLIISGGINIYPEEIEELLVAHPAVKEVRVVGENHELLGEVPVAAILLQDEFDKPLKTELIRFCTEQLAEYKVPTRIDYVENLPKTSTGKIKRF